MSAFRMAAASAAFYFFVAGAVAQCELDWQPGAPASGPNSLAQDLELLPDGTLVACGGFRVADAAIVNNVAQWNGSTWLPMDEGLPGAALVVKRAPNGDFYAGGRFSVFGGGGLQRIARWDGATWQPLAAVPAGPVAAIEFLPNGDLVAGLENGGVQVWDGSTWTTLGALAGAASLALAPNGDLLAGGRFVIGGGITALARWDGFSWVAVPGFSAVTFGARQLLTLANGDVFLAGRFTLLGSAAQINSAIYDGITVVDAMAPTSDVALDATLRSNGDVTIVVGSFAGGGSVATWNGASWSQQPPLPEFPHAVVEDSAGQLVVSTSQLFAANQSRGVLRLGLGGWELLGAPAPPSVGALATTDRGDSYIGGAFSTFLGVPAANIVRFDGSAYSALGAGVDGEVAAIAVAPDGSVVVGGSFQTVGGGVAAAGIARWDGVSWSALGSLPAAATASNIAIADDGTIYAGADSLWQFDGVSWAQIPLPGLQSTIRKLAVLPSQRLAIAGEFRNVPGQPVQTGLLEYDGSTVVPFPVGPGQTLVSLDSMLVAANGDLVVLERFSSFVRRWNGVTWSNVGLDLEGEFVELPNGDFVGDSPQGLVRIQNGSNVPLTIESLRVDAIGLDASGQLLIGGAMQSVNGLVSIGYARAVPPCGGAVVTVGGGCAGSAGPLTLASDGLAWIGSAYRSTALGLPAQSLAVQAFGAPAPSQQLPLAPAGCSVDLNPFVTTVEIPINGAASMAFALPNAAALIGAVLRQQVIGVELGAFGIRELTSSNALDLTIGAL